MFYRSIAKNFWIFSNNLHLERQNILYQMIGFDIPNSNRNIIYARYCSEYCYKHNCSMLYSCMFELKSFISFIILNVLQLNFRALYFDIVR